MYYNKAIIAGNITHDLELRTSSSGKPFMNFSIAVNKKLPSGENSADFIKATAFGSTAETIAKYCAKGSNILVEGTISTSQYQDKRYPDVTHHDFSIMVQSFRFGDKTANENAPASQNINAPVPQVQSQARQFAAPPMQSNTQCTGGFVQGTAQISPADFGEEIIDGTVIPF